MLLVKSQLQQEWLNYREMELRERPVWIGAGNIRRLADAQLADALDAGYDVTRCPFRMKVWQEFAALDAGYELREEN